MTPGRTVAGRALGAIALAGALALAFPGCDGCLSWSSANQPRLDAWHGDFSHLDPGPAGGEYEEEEAGDEESAEGEPALDATAEQEAPCECDLDDDCATKNCQDKACVGCACRYTAWSAEKIAVVCDDGIKCNVDGCDEAVGCTHSFDPSGPCPDLGCLPGADDLCNDSDDCTWDTCVPCPADSVDCGASMWVCSHLKCPGCRTGVPCYTYRCDSATSAVHVLKNCKDVDPCTRDLCNVDTGLCEHQVVPPEICNPCVTAADCTVERLPELAQKCLEAACVDGQCTYQARSCDDGDPCTVDTCTDAAGCAHQDTCLWCDPQNSQTCNDGTNNCLDSTCVEGMCRYAPAGCGTTDATTWRGCDVTTMCQEKPFPVLPVGTLCTHDADCYDLNPCTDDHCDPTLGECQYTAHDCDDHEACTVDTCSLTKGCQHSPVPGCESACTKDADCDDANPCTDDRCQGPDGQGKCVHVEQCDDEDPCTLDYCDATLGCRHLPVSFCN